MTPEQITELRRRHERDDEQLRLLTGLNNKIAELQALQRALKGPKAVPSFCYAQFNTGWGRWYSIVVDRNEKTVEDFFKANGCLIMDGSTELSHILNIAAREAMDRLLVSKIEKIQAEILGL